ncbi:hypothetical protein LTR78_002557 [Recurvomyces mirabilis]|uniref:3'-5' exonuclease domain-containing protein n=1 Tax=Recurvomyces mirabilis TaxID=574656 RepID=A0AAE0WTA1_9PEZI|nr:hypothetical protein LTR78_002557 [Recurvomyces mirabilis]KAK5157486.1 hypothetical protein LTS14_004251 [Recurvomyces mirabilis]
MPPQRAVTANTAAVATATTRLVMARTAGSMDTHSTTTVHDNEDGEYNDGPDVIVRLPSIRPIDQRWDRSRGIVFGSAPRNPDSTRVAPNSITCGIRSTQTRRYAQRALPASRPYQQPATSPKATTLSDNPYHTPTPLRIASDSQKMIDLGKEKDHWKAKEAQVALKHKKALEVLEDLRKRAQAREDDLEADLRKACASKEHQQRDHTRALDEQRKKVLEGSETTMSRLRGQVASLTQLSDHFKNKAAELEQDMNTQDEEHKRDLAAQQKRLEMSLSLQLAEQRRQGQIRKNERATYEDYRKVYNELIEAVREFYNPIFSMERALFAVINRRGSLNTHSDGMNKINPIVLVSRGKLFRRLDECQQALVAKHEEEGQSLQSLRNAMQEKVSNFSNAAHESRTQSRYHRIDQTQTKMETADVLHYVANDLPVRQESRAVEGEMKSLQESMDREQDETVVASLQAQYADLSTTRTSLSSLIGLFARLRDIAALEALLSDNIVEKEVFVASLEAQSRIEQAGRMWIQAVAKSAFVNAESDVSFEDQASTRKEYTRNLRQTHQRLDEYKENVRKRVWLQQYLGLTKPGLEDEADAIIKERIDIARVEERGLLKKFGVQRMNRSSSFARAVSPTRSTRRVRRMEARASSEPPKASTAINSTESTTAHRATAFGLPLRSMERNLSELKRRLLRLPEGTEKVWVAAETESLRRKVGSINLSNLQRNRELARQPNNEDLPARSTGAKSVLADATSKGPTTSANAVVRRSPTRASIVRTSASTYPNGTRSAFRRTFSSGCRSSSNPGLMLGNVSDDMAGLDGLESAMQQTTISGSLNDTLSTSSNRSPSISPGLKASKDGSTPIGSAPDMSDPGNSTKPGEQDGGVDDVESTSQPRFRIPDSAYREAALASPSSNAAYWSYRLYKDDKGRSPSVHYCTNAQQAERELQHFIGKPLIGFDMEWDSTANKNSHAKRNAALIQIACEDRICLIHIARFPSDDPDQLVPPTLRIILESTGTIKAGVNIQGDARRMREYLGTEVRAQFELSHLYKVVTFDRADINKTLKGASMAVQVQKILRLPLKKDDVRVSAWTRPLNQEQCDYSASDAYAGYQLFRELEVRREMMDPRPPRPAWQELKEPLVLGDGTKLRARPKGSAVSAAKASTSTPAEELDDDAEEEFYDALETQDAIGALVVPLQGISISCPSLPFGSDDATASSKDPELHATTAAPAIQDNIVPDKPSAIITTEHTSCSELDQADSWIARYRTSWRIQPGKSRASVPNLRAHHLWHEQRLEIAQAAALLRDPPLSINTVASYVLEAIRHEDLPFKAVRLREVLGLMPEVVKHISGKEYLYYHVYVYKDDHHDERVVAVDVTHDPLNSEAQL